MIDAQWPEWPRLEFEDGTLELAQLSDAQEVLRYELANRERFIMWEPPSPIVDLESCLATLSRYHAAWQERSSLNLYLFDERRQVLGHVSLLRYSRHPRNNAQICYGMDAAWAGRGVMRRALMRVLRFAFLELGMKRVEAQIYTENQRSIHLVRSLGMVHEGELREALFVAGKWVNLMVYGILDRELAAP